MRLLPDDDFFKSEDEGDSSSTPVVAIILGAFCALFAAAVVLVFFLYRRRRKALLEADWMERREAGTAPSSSKRVEMNNIIDDQVWDFICMGFLQKVDVGE